MKEFTICYTLDNDIIIEKIIKESDVKKEDVEKEIYGKMDCYKYLIVRNDQDYFIINSLSVRYVQIMKEKILVK
ncbi:hypothetical protein [Neobacillus bataviensis]|uniref:hypothetical protein n=1 Tax=Neobacillus bataviensis TaxID=220685 RepID=UPI001CBAC372|nr:hypothetical protein [Neobacillus bataviensis]